MNAYPTHRKQQDNGRAMNVDQLEEIHVTDTIIIGHTDGYKQVVSKGGLGNPVTPCFGNSDLLHGIAFQPAKPILHLDDYESPLNGIIMKNVSFSGFEPNACGEVFPLGLLSKSPSGIKNFHSYTTLTDVDIDPASKGVDFCNGVSRGIDDVYVTDLSGSVDSVVPSGVPQTLLRDSSFLMHFILPGTTCISSNCLTTCRNTCFRSVHVYLHKATSHGYSLRVADRNDVTFPHLEISGAEHANRQVKVFTVHLASGRQYDAYFVDSNGATVFPEDADVVYRDQFCTLAPQEQDFQLLGDWYNFCDRLTEPSVAQEASNWGIRKYGTIQQQGTAVKYVAGSSFVINSGPKFQAFSIDYNRACFKRGTTWVFRARLKLLDTGTTIGASCSTTSSQNFVRCPVIVLNVEDEYGTNIELVVDGFDGSTPWDPNGFNQFEGRVTLPTQSLSGKTRAMFMNFARFPTAKDLLIENFEILADGIDPPTESPIDRPTVAPVVAPTNSPVDPPTNSPTLLPTDVPLSTPTMTPTETPTSVPTKQPSKSPVNPPTPLPTTSPSEPLTDICSVLVEVDEALPANWNSRGRGSIIPVPGQPELVRWETNRNNGRRTGPELATFDSQDTRDCMKVGVVYEIRAMVHLRERSSGNGAFCDISSTTPYVGCPAALISFYDSNRVLREKIIYGYSGLTTWDVNGFNQFIGTFTVSASDVSPNEVRFNFARFPRGVNVDLKTVSISKI